jgi:hypothetical protein
MDTTMSTEKSLAVEINDVAETLHLTFLEVNAVLAEYNINTEVWVWPDGAEEKTSGYQLGIAQPSSKYELAFRYCEIDKSDPDEYGQYELSVVRGSCSAPMPIVNADREQQTQMISQMAQVIDALKYQMGDQLESIRKGKEAAGKFVEVSR